MVGHSLGGITVALFAQHNPQKIKALAPISTVVSGQLSLVMHSKEKLIQWQKTGWLEEENHSKLGVIKRMGWHTIQDGLKYDLLANINKLNLPISLIAGQKDDSTPPRHQKIFFNALPTKHKELHIIKGALHTFRQKTLEPDLQYF